MTMLVVARRGFSGVVYLIIVPTASRRTAVLVGPFELQSVVLYVPTQIDP